jgi:crossover junction endodeoxyribonuclease RuvC
MKICGIDPGRKGALVSLEGNVIKLRSMPDNEKDLFETLVDLCPDVTHVFVEKAQSLPGNGSVGMFHYGDGFGQIKGVLAAMRIPYTLVPPRTWTKVMHAGCDVGEPKARSLEAVRRLFPNIELRRTERCRNLDEGFIDALLIAEYGRRTLSGHL